MCFSYLLSPSFHHTERIIIIIFGKSHSEVNSQKGNNTDEGICIEIGKAHTTEALSATAALPVVKQ